MHKYLRILRYARRQRGLLFLLVPLSLLAASLDAVQPWPIKLFIDHVLDNHPVPDLLRRSLAAVSLSSDRSVLLVLVVVGGLVVFALNSTASSLTNWIRVKAGNRTIYDLAEDLFSRLQRRSLLYHKATGTGERISRVLNDSRCAYQILADGVLPPVEAFFTTLAMLAMMAWLSVPLTLLAVGLSSLVVPASMFFGKRMRARANMKREIEGQIQSHVQQVLTGIPVVQAFAQEEREETRFQKFASVHIRVQQLGALLRGFNNLGSGFAGSLGFGVMIWVVARQILRGEISLGSALVFAAYFRTLQTQIKVFANIYPVLQNLRANVDRVIEVLDTPPEVSEAPGAVALPPIAGSVVFENVTAGYVPGRPVISHLSFKVPAGRTIGIVGPTGAGKTTLMNLILRFEDPWSGRVLIDGHDVRDVRIESLRRQVSVVLQEPFLLPLSVAQNIAYGRPEATPAEIEAAARAANAHDFITALPQGYHTVLGERGAALSGGMKQRVALARALLRNAPILILDEITRALDSETERQIIDELRRVRSVRTVFIIAHRLSTVRDADTIIFLHDGRIVETGSHTELLNHSGHYARLHRSQQREEVPGSPVAI